MTDYKIGDILNKNSDVSDSKRLEVIGIHGKFAWCLTHCGGRVVRSFDCLERHYALAVITKASIFVGERYATLVKDNYGEINAEATFENGELVKLEIIK